MECKDFYIGKLARHKALDPSSCEEICTSTRYTPLSFDCAYSSVRNLIQC